MKTSRQFLHSSVLSFMRGTVTEVTAQYPLPPQLFPTQLPGLPPPHPPHPRPFRERRRSVGEQLQFSSSRRERSLPRDPEGAGSLAFFPLPSLTPQVKPFPVYWLFISFSLLRVSLALKRTNTITTKAQTTALYLALFLL